MYNFPFFADASKKEGEKKKMMELKDKKVFETTIGDRKVTVETGHFCGLANGSCIVRCGETVVMVNATMADKARDGIDFFPLVVDFEEKMYSIGKIPGGWKRREGRASDKAILTSRLIDRPLRPLFDKGFRNDVAIVATTLSVEPDVYPEPLAMFGASVALSISDIPFNGPVGSVNIALIDGKYVINPNPEQNKKTKLFATISGTEDAVLMIEVEAEEASEKEVLATIMEAHKHIKLQCKFQQKMMKEVGKPKNKNIKLAKIDEQVEKEVKIFAINLIEKAFDNTDRQARQEAEGKITDLVFEHIEKTLGKEKLSENKLLIIEALEYLKKQVVRTKILTKNIRPDGRKVNEIRPIWCEVGMLPRVHGSAIFTRGQTQAMTVTTLGMLSDVQELESLDDEVSKRYMHHYNMPAYSLGEAKGLKGAGRREIGHGALAEKALEMVLPSEEEFPYAIRTVSEILSSNGSTSMASVCGSTMSLMDAGVPLKAPIAGIAMGLIKEGKKSAILTDIQGIEDFYGDMDFKVTGSEKGITAMQMDMKIAGISEDELKEALEQAKKGRMHIMDIMLKAIKTPREKLSKYAPKIITFKINPDKIREVIGSGGKVINEIIKQTGVKIDIDDEGVVCIGTADEAAAAKAKNIILTIAEDIKIGTKYTGKVVKIANFGCFVELAPGKDGMVHISKLDTKRVEKVEDIVKLDDVIEVEVIKIDEKGRVDLRRIVPKA